MNRISRLKMFYDLLSVIEKRSTCDRKKVAAIIEREGRIISMGYAGAPSGLPHCIDVGCKIDPDTGGCIRTVHAEANAIAFAAKNGISTEGATLYCTMSPCLNCAKLIINCGIKEVIYKEEYRNKDGINLLKEAGVKVGR
jgi:dCMP deaminase